MSPDRAELKPDGLISKLVALAVGLLLTAGMVWWYRNAESALERAGAGFVLAFWAFMWGGFSYRGVHQHRALERARARGGLTHIVWVSRMGFHDFGYLTLHHETGDIGFYSARRGTGRDFYIPRQAITNVVPIPSQVRIEWLGDRVESRTFATPSMLLAWVRPMPAAIDVSVPVARVIEH